jgi:hypothetical protein
MTLHITVRESEEYIQQYDEGRFEPSQLLFLDDDFVSPVSILNPNDEPQVNSNNSLRDINRYDDIQTITALSYLQPKHLPSLIEYLRSVQPSTVYVNCYWIGHNGMLQLIRTLEQIPVKELYLGFSFGGPDPLEMGQCSLPKWYQDDAPLWNAIVHLLQVNPAIETLRTGLCLTDPTLLEKGIAGAKNLQKIGYFAIEEGPEWEEVVRYV